MKPAPPVTTNTAVTRAIVAPASRPPQRARGAAAEAVTAFLLVEQRYPTIYTIPRGRHRKSHPASRRQRAVFHGDALARDQHVQSHPDRSSAVRAPRSPLRRRAPRSVPRHRHLPGRHDRHGGGARRDAGALAGRHRLTGRPRVEGVLRRGAQPSAGRSEDGGTAGRRAARSARGHGGGRCRRRRGRSARGRPRPPWARCRSR